MLVAEGLSFRYPSGQDILFGWSEAFHAGEVVSVTGPSGRGKSTLLYLLGLMLTPSQGCVRIEGTVASTLSDRERARLRAFQFGFVFQDAALDPARSVLDNVIETSLYRSENRVSAVGRARELLTEFGVEMRAESRPGQVSGGQAQRIALCRALHGRPRILLADEPTGNLDRESSALVMSALRGAARDGAAVVVVTHDPDAVAQSDREVRL